MPKKKSPSPAAKSKSAAKGGSAKPKPNPKRSAMRAATRGPYRTFPREFIDENLTDQKDPKRFVISEIIDFEDLKCKYAAWVISQSDRKPEAAGAAGISLRTIYNLADRWLDRRKPAGGGK